MSDIPGATPAGGPDLPPDLRFLKILVTLLAATMIIGLIAMIALFVIRLPGVNTSAPVLPETVALPAGETARAVTFGDGWIAVVTTRDEILILDQATGALRQRIAIEP
jgi:hypothetical protein